MRLSFLIVVSGASLVLAACGTTTVRSVPVPPPVTVSPPAAAVPAPSRESVPEAPAPAVPEPRRAPPPRQLADGSQVPAVRGLVAAADGALAKGDVELAAVNLERAQRLAPQSALVYQKLATVRLRQQRPAEAEQLARKALAYAGSSAQQAALWQLIARARLARGQQEAAREAQERAAALQQAGGP